MTTTVDLEPEVYHLAQKIAEQRHQSVGAVIGEAVLQHFKNEPTLESLVPIGESGLPELRLGRKITFEEVRAAIEEE